MEVNVDNHLEPVPKEILIKSEENVNEILPVKNENETESIAKEMQIKYEEKVNELKADKKESGAEEIQLKSEEEDKEIDPDEKENQSESVVKEDPFAYLDRDDFTSEKYKIEIRNLPKHYGIAVSTIKPNLLNMYFKDHNFVIIVYYFFLNIFRNSKN